MKRTDLNRRDFNRLTAAAFGGILTGSLAGCGSEEAAPPKPDAPADTTGTTDPPAGDEGATDVALLLEEPHVCRGLNTCKGKGAGGENECAGQGACATAAHHDCHTKNECKGQGGCGSSAGENACKGKGECAVPLGDGIWKKTRDRFATAMKEKNDKEIGAAPEKKEAPADPAPPADAPKE